jgi:hypothetical protein
MKAQNRFFAVFMILLSLLVFASAKANENGEIRMEVVDETGSPALGAMVTLLSGDQVMEKKITALEGLVNFKAVRAGKYDLKIEMMGMITYVKKDVEVTADHSTYVTIRLKENTTLLDSVEVFPYEKPIILGCPGGGFTIPVNTIEHLPAPHSDIVSVLTSVMSDLQPTDDGKDFYSRGARSGSNEYMIDGEKVIGSFGVPSLSIWEITVYTGGTPACYGDFTGGLVMITTKSFFNGIQQKRQMYEEISRNIEGSGQ